MWRGCTGSALKAFAKRRLIFKFLTLVLVGLTIWKSAGPRWRAWLMIGAWLVLELWGVTGIFFERYGGGMFQFLSGLVLSGRCRLRSG